MKNLVFGVSYVLLVCGLSSNAFAQEEPAAKKEDALSPLRSLYRDEAAAYRLFLDAEHKQGLTLEPEPVMSWTGTDGWSGDVFLWTREGRPQVIGGVGSWPEGGRRNLFHEFHTLTLDPLPEVQLGSAATWKPDQAGVTLRDVVAAPAPARSSRLRLIQMGRIAETFEGHLRGPAGEEELRLLPKPLYRYDKPTGDVIEGALFGFVFASTGTDLDLLLLLECRKTDEGPRWQYAPARFTNKELWLRHGGEEVWRAPVHREPPTGGFLHKPYLTVRTRSVEISEIESPQDE